jgi:hypothetical protein
LTSRECHPGETARGRAAGVLYFDEGKREHLPKARATDHIARFAKRGEI